MALNRPLQFLQNLFGSWRTVFWSKLSGYIRHLVYSRICRNITKGVTKQSNVLLSIKTKEKKNCCTIRELKLFHTKYHGRRHDYSLHENISRTKLVFEETVCKGQLYIIGKIFPKRQYNFFVGTLEIYHIISNERIW